MKKVCIVFEPRPKTVAVNEHKIFNTEVADFVVAVRYRLRVFFRVTRHVQQLAPRRRTGEQAGETSERSCNSTHFELIEHC